VLGRTRGAWWGCVITSDGNRVSLLGAGKWCGTVETAWRPRGDRAETGRPLSCAITTDGFSLSRDSGRHLLVQCPWRSHPGGRVRLTRETMAVTTLPPGEGCRSRVMIHGISCCGRILFLKTHFYIAGVSVPQN